MNAITETIGNQIGGFIMAAKKGKKASKKPAAKKPAASR
jgi:hypothetical protein